MQKWIKIDQIRKIKQLLCLFTFLCLPFKSHFSFVKKINRGPASEVIDTEMIEKVEMYPHWYKRVVVEDYKGVMKNMRLKMRRWQANDEYHEQWNISEHLDRRESLDSRKAFIRRQALKYVDKRLSGSLKTADKDSNFYRVAQAKKSLSPSSQVQVSENFKLKLRAKVLQGQATLLLSHTFFDTEAIVKASGRANFRIKKEIKEIGLHTLIDLDAQTGRWIASIDKRLDENWTTRVTSDQDNADMAFTKSADTRVELFYAQPF